MFVTFLIGVSASDLSFSRSFSRSLSRSLSRSFSRSFRWADSELVTCGSATGLTLRSGASSVLFRRCRSSSSGSSDLAGSSAGFDRCFSERRFSSERCFSPSRRARDDFRVTPSSFELRFWVDAASR